MRTALYRHWNENGDLLYVGISIKPFHRLEQHGVGSHWSSEIRNVTIEYFESREEAENAERAAIATEFPLHNVVHNGDGGIKEIEFRETEKKEYPYNSDIDDHVLFHATRRGAYGTEPDEVFSAIESDPVIIQRYGSVCLITRDMFDRSLDRLAAAGRIISVGDGLYPPIFCDYIHKFLVPDFDRLLAS